MSFHLGLRFFLIVSEIFGFNKFYVLHIKKIKLISNLYYSVHFVVFSSFFLTFVVLYFKQHLLTFSGIGNEQATKKEDNFIPILLNFLYSLSGFFYIFMAYFIIIYSRIYTENILRFLRKLKKQSCYNENYLYLIINLLLSAYFIFISIHDIRNFVTRFQSQNYFLTWCFLGFLHANFRTQNFVCQFVSFTEQISSSFKIFLRDVKTFEKIIYGKVFRPNSSNEKIIFKNLSNSAFSIIKVTEYFNSYFQIPICFICIVNLFHFSVELIRLAKSGIQENFLMSLSAMFMTFVIFYLSDAVNVKVNIELL